MGHVLPNAQAIELVEGKFQGALTKYAELRYKPWGEDRPASDAFNETLSPSERRFTGQRAHDHLGLYYYKARWYDPVLGRFVQPDSIVRISRIRSTGIATLMPEIILSAL